MSLELTNSVHVFTRDLSNFVEAKKIDETKVNNIDVWIDEVRNYKAFFTGINKRTMDTIKIFSGLNVLEHFFIFSKKHLLEGIAKKENPKSAREILVFEEDLVFLANQIDSYKENRLQDTPNQVNFISRQLRERFRDAELFPSIEELEKTERKNKEWEKLNGIILEKALLSET